MAGRPKKENNPQTKEVIIEQKQNQKSYEDLESELDELKNLVKSLIASKEDKIETAKEEIEVPIFKPQPKEEYGEIHSSKRIKVISLTDGILVLTTAQYGQGKPYQFDKFGETKNIIYADLADILHYQNRFAEMGLFYICDDNVIANHGLYDIYQNLLSKEIIEKLLDYNRKEMVELFNNSTEMQKEQIVSIIARKIANGEDIDLNKVDALSRIYTRSIVEIAEEYKQIQVG